MHAPDQNVLDYKAQRDARNAANLAMALTVLAGVFSSFGFSTLAVKLFISPYADRFFPGYVPLSAGFPVYSPYALYEAYTRFWHYPMMQHAFYFAAAGTGMATLAVAVWQFVSSGKKQNAVYETDLHGSAHWATEKEVAQMALLPTGKGPQSRRICYVG
ncbi:MAG: type IV secretory system conjugative DNA transfer family protein, partial [Acidithiobacillus sp.]